jgi:uncharacterized protein
VVRVENLTRQTDLVSAGKIANTHWTRLRGLIGVRDLPAGHGLIIEPCHGVHCLFMSIRIDVVYANRQHQVVALDRAMKPWSFGRIYRDSRYVVEGPVGMIERTGTQVGDQLRVTVG